MVKTAQILHRRHPGIGFLLSVAPSIETGFIMEHLNGVDRDLPIELVFGGARHVLHRSWMVLAVSGTVTLEAALCGIPMVIFYKLSPVSCYLGKKLVKVDYFSLVNLIAQRRLVPEFLQDDAGPENLANAMEDLMIDPGAYARRRYELLRLRKRLGGSGAAVRVAESAMKLIKR
jgi:lipid-A-disaccharide synthase